MISEHRINEIFETAKSHLDDERDFEEYFKELKSHYSDDELEKGYAIISDSKGHGASRIKAIPELGRCFSDKEAMICAKQDGIRIIEDVVFVKHHRAFFIDTPENRMILAPLVQNNPAARIVISDNGRKIIEIQNIKFSGKRKIDWEGVEAYLKKYVGKSYMLDETDEMIYIGTDFPDEYSQSRDSKKAFGAIGKAKANASQAIAELVQTASDVKFVENKDEKHKDNAKYGWYWCTIHFSLPITDDKRNITGKNFFRGRMVIRHSKSGKNYLYDIVDIKKET